MDEYCLQTYDPADETINFGFRNVGNDLFESVTLMSLRNHSIGDDVRISSYMHMNALYFSIDCCLWIVSDFEKGIITFEKKFDAYIDTFKLIDNYLLIGLCNGRIHLLNITTKEILSSCTVFENVWLESKFVIGIYQDIHNNNLSELCFILITKKGAIYNITVDLSNDNEMKTTLLTELSHTITSALYTNGRVIAIGNKCFLYDVFEKEVYEVLLNGGALVKRVWTCNSSSVIALLNDGTLCKICTNTLIFHDVDLEKMEDFIYYYHKDRTLIYYVPTCEDNSDSKIIKLVQYPDDEEIFSLEVNHVAHLVFNNEEDANQVYITQENDKIRFHLIKEAKPEGRLQRLIRKKQFEEAEAFAAQYGLSQLDIDKAKVVLFVEKASCDDKNIEDMIALMEIIPDRKFRLQQCLKVSCETIQGVDRVLKYALSLDLDFNDFNDDDLEVKFKSVVVCFDTYKILARCENNEMNTHDWKDFCEFGLHQHLHLTLKKGKLESAIILLSRLGKEFFALDNIAKVLNYMDDYPIKSFTSLLYTMIPKSLLYLPTSLPIFIQRIVTKVQLLEKHKRELEFPECAIDFIDKVLSILHYSVANIGSHHGSHCNAASIDVKKELEILVNISNCLDTILELKNNYDIYLPLNDCVQGPGAMLKVLLKLNIGSIEKFLQEFLIQFMIRNGFNADEILSEEIQDLLRYEEMFWAPIVPQIWRSISSTNVRLLLLLDILKAAAKPWCNDIRQILNSALKLKHPLVSKIEREAKNEPKYIILHRPGYNLKNETLNSLESDMFVINRIIYCNQPTLIEDVHTLCSTDSRKNEVNFYLIQNFIKKGEISKVFDLIDSHSPTDLMQYTCTIYRFLWLHKALIINNIELRKNFMKCLNYIIEKSADKKLFPPVDAKWFKIFDIFPSHLYQNNPLPDVHNQKQRMETLNLLIDDLSINLEEEIDFAHLVREVSRYALAFEIQPEEILLKLCQKRNDFSLLESSATFISDNCEEVKTMCLMTTLILKLVGTERVDLCPTFFNDTVTNDDSDKPVDEKVLRNCLSLARNIAGRAYLMSKGEVNVCNVYDWAITTTCLVEDISEKFVQKHHFSLSGTGTHSFTINAIRDVFVMFTGYLHGHRLSPAVEYLTFDAVSDPDITSMESLFNLILSKLQSSLQGILRENNYWMAQRLLTTLANEICKWREYEFARKLWSYVNTCKNNLLIKVFAEKDIDDELAFLLLVSYPRKKALKIINDALVTYKLNISKFEAIVKLGRRLTKHYESGDNYRQFMLSTKLWKAIENCCFTYKDFCIHLSKGDLMTQLIQLNQLTLPQISEFCADFNYDLDTYHLKYLYNLISTWKPVFDVQFDSFGNRNVVILSREQDLINDCMNVVELIKNRDAVLKCIYDLWAISNFYHYEIYIAILVIAANLNDSQYMHFKTVLQFLKNYSRSSKPSLVETEQWFTRFMCNQPLDPIAEWRLPFSTTLFSVDFWKILRPELKLSNYEKWFELVGILENLNVDDICSIVIKDITFNSDHEECGYYLHAKFDHLFLEIDKCIGCISNPMVAASIAFNLIAKTPEGADKVTAAKLAFKYGKQYEPTYNNIEVIYCNYLSKHILHVYNLATLEYLSKLNYPVELIEALYQDERILKAGNSFLSQCPNINKAVDELAQLFQIDIRTKRKELLKILLCDTASFSSDMDQSINLSPEVNFSGEENVDCILRASYMCSGDDVKFWRDYLYSLALEIADKSLFQARVFKTFSMITSPDEVEKRSGVIYTDFLVTIDQFFLIHDIRSLGMSIDMERLAGLPKDRFLKKLSKNASRNPIHVKIMISICNLYDIYDLSIWEKIMLALIKLNMITELKNCLNTFQKHDIVVWKAFFIKAWQTVVDSTFMLSESYKQTDLEKALVENIHYIQSCPVLNQLNLIKVQNICIKLKRYDLAALLLQYKPEDKQEETAKQLLHHIHKENLLTALKNLSDIGFIGLEYVSKFIAKVE